MYVGKAFADIHVLAAQRTLVPGHCQTHLAVYHIEVLIRKVLQDLVDVVLLV